MEEERSLPPSSPTSLDLCTNHFRVKLSLNVTLHQYKVDITSNGKNKVIESTRRKILRDTLKERFFLEEFFYDGEKTVFLKELLTVTESVFPNAYDFGMFYIKITFNKSIQISPDLQRTDTKVSEDVLYALNTILQHHAIERGDLFVGQSIFLDDKKCYVNVGGGVTGIQGFYLRFCTEMSGLTLNMDMSSTTMLTPGRVLACLKDNQGIEDHLRIDWKKANEILKDRKVKTDCDDEVLKIKELSKETCKQLFCMKGGPKPVNVYNYYAKLCKPQGPQPITLADIPCIDVGGPNKPNYVPIELCSLVPLQKYTRSISASQRSSLAAQSRSPAESMKALTDFLKDYFCKANSSLSAIGVSIENHPISVRGRVLPAPELKFGPRKKPSMDRPTNGQWNYDGKRLVTPVKIKNWCVVDFSSGYNSVELVKQLVQCAKDKKIRMAMPVVHINEEEYSKSLSPEDRVQNMFRQIKKEKPNFDLGTLKMKYEGLQLRLRFEFVLCIMEKNSDIYGPWMEKCLTEAGVISQCISVDSETSPTTMHNQYLADNILEINIKLGGINFWLSNVPCIISKTPTLILGMSIGVSPRPGHSNIPSIASVVGSSYWPCFSTYGASVRTQSSTDKMFTYESLYNPSAKGQDEGIIRELLLEFFDSNRQEFVIPGQILIFRDGVSESQFSQVLEIELEAIKKAIKQLLAPPPKFTVIVAQRSPRSKLFGVGGVPGNVPPGTVVDVHSKFRSFYMCPHHVASGTSVPTLYSILKNEIGISFEDLQNLVHSFSYVYQTKTASIPIVAPIQYARCAASQVRHFLKSGKLRRLHPSVANEMLFC